MVNKTLTFSGIVCYINDFKIETDNFKEVVQSGSYDEVSGNRVHIFQMEYEKNFLKINFSDGSAMPRNPNVYNKSKQEFEPNPRDSDQIEPKEYFAVFDLTSSYLWLSNTKKKSLLIDFFQKMFKNKKIVLKDVYDEEKFIEGLKTLDQIKLSAAPSLFSQSNTVSKALIDEMYGAFEAVLHLKYKDTFIGDDLYSKIKSIFKNRESFNGIMIAGRDEKNMGMFFNNNLFTRKIDIEAPVDENEMFNPSDVFSRIIAKIEEEINANS
jgi:hypothetical protein